jgi:ornithine carbamoyltransferase
MTEQERERFTVVFNASRGVYELCQHHREEMVRDVAAVLRSVVDQIRTLDETLKGKGMSMTEPERERFAVVSNALRGVYELCQHHREEMVRDVAAVLRSVVDQTRTLDEMLAARR